MTIRNYLPRVDIKCRSCYNLLRIVSKLVLLICPARPRPAEKPNSEKRVLRMKKNICIVLTVIMLFGCINVFGSELLYSDWAKEGIEAAVALNIVPQTLKEDDLREDVTREEFCEMAVAVYEKLTGKYASLPKEYYFDDTLNLTVSTAYELGIVAGKGNGKFDPDSPITREEMAKMFDNLITASGKKIDALFAAPSAPDAAKISAWALPAFTNIYGMQVIRGMDDGRLAPQSNSTKEQSIIMAYRFSDYFINPKPSPSPVPSPALPNGGPIVETDEEKYQRIFGEGDITTKEFADSLMKTITVRVWDFDGNGNKVEKKKSLTVHKNIAGMVEDIFEEIFNGKEKFPIKSVGAYAWREPMASGRLSHHNYGTAIDINPDENYCLYKDGSFIGKYWKPGEDPYSFPEDGEVVKIFAKYGFKWGGNAWSNPKDYMHFTYLGL